MAYVLNNCTGNSKSGSWKKNQYKNATKNVVLETVKDKTSQPASGADCVKRVAVCENIGKNIGSKPVDQ